MLKKKLIVLFTCLVGVFTSRAQTLDSVFNAFVQAAEYDSNLVKVFDSIVLNSREEVLISVLKMGHYQLDHFGYIDTSLFDQYEQRIYSQSKEKAVYYRILKLRGYAQSNNERNLKKELLRIEQDAFLTNDQLSAAYQNVGAYYYSRLKYDTAVVLFEKQLESALSAMDSALVTSAYINLGSTANGLRLYSSALYYQLEAKKWSQFAPEVYNDLLNNNLAAIEMVRGNFEESYQYLQKVDFSFTSEISKHNDTDVLLVGNLVEVEHNLGRYTLSKEVIPYMLSVMQSNSGLKNLMASRILMLPDSLLTFSKASFYHQYESEIIKDTLHYIEYVLPQIFEFDFISKDLYASLSSYAMLHAPEMIDEIIYYGIDKDFLDANTQEQLEQLSLNASERNKDRVEAFTRDVTYLERLYDLQGEYDQVVSELTVNRRQVYYQWGAIILMSLIVLLLVLYYRSRAALNNAEKREYQAEKERVSVENEMISKEVELQQLQMKELELKSALSKEIIPLVDQVFDVAGDKNAEKKVKELKVDYKVIRDKIVGNIDVPIHKTSLYEFELQEKARHFGFNDVELKVLKLMHLNMSSKEIGVSLNKKAGYIDNVRSRIRKKLNLEKGEDILSALNAEA